MAEQTRKYTLSSQIYAAVKNKHPEWSQARVYAVTRGILSTRAQKAEAAAKK